MPTRRAPPGKAPLGKPPRQKKSAPRPGPIAKQKAGVHLDRHKPAEIIQAKIATPKPRPEAAQAEPFFRNLVERAPAVALKLDRDGIILYANPAAAFFWGRPGENLVGRRWHEIFGNDPAAPILWSDFLPHATAENDISFRDAHGRLRTMVWHMAALKPSRALFAYGIDIAARKRMEGELRERETALTKSREHLAYAQKISNSGSGEHDLKANEFIWSDGLFHIFGLDPAATPPDREAFARLVHPDDLPRLQTGFDQARSGVDPTPIEYRILRSDGKERVVRSEAHTVMDAAGRPAHVIFTVTDITERRQMERERLELERQLQHSQRLEALGTLAGGIAHDLNNALVPVIALTKMVIDHLPEESRDRANLEIVRIAGLRAKALVQQVVAFSRNQVPAKEALRFDQIVREALAVLRASVPPTIGLQPRIEKVPVIQGDSTQMFQILFNLVTNAVQAIGDQTGTIIVEVAGEREQTDRPAMVRLSVIDDGAGMDDAVRRRIFEPFFTTKPVNKGTGLGLSVVHGIVVSHQGRIEVTSRVGEGTRFDIFLPVAPVSRPAIATDGSPRHEP